MTVCKYVEILVPLPVVSIFYYLSTDKGNGDIIKTCVRNFFAK